MTDDVAAEPAGASDDPVPPPDSGSPGDPEYEPAPPEAGAHPGEDPVDPLGAGRELEGQALAWCIVANVAQETNQGEGGLEIRSGIKHFSAGAKVWVLPVQSRYGGEKVFVVGRHRGSSGPYIRMIVPRRHLTNFRVRLVYSPALLRALLKPHDGKFDPSLRDRATLEGAAADWNERPIEARLVGGRWRHMDMVSDPPPLELRFMRETYYLAHLNARRAVYSKHMPPVEIAPPVEPPPSSAQP